MTNYAVIHNNTVSNIIVADTLTIAEEVTQTSCVALEEGQVIAIGMTYDGKTFTTPVIE